MPRTELVWDGKYDAAGKRVSPFREPVDRSPGSRRKRAEESGEPG